MPVIENSEDSPEEFKIPDIRLNRCKCGQVAKLENHVDNEQGMAIIECKCGKQLLLEINTKSPEHIDNGYTSLMNRWNMYNAGGKHVF